MMSKLENYKQLDKERKIRYMEVDIYRGGEYVYTEVFSKEDLKKVYWNNGFFVVESIRGTYLFSSISVGLIEFYYEGQEIESCEEKKKKKMNKKIDWEKLRIQIFVSLKKISFYLCCIGCLFIVLGLPFCCIGALCPSDPLLCSQFNIIWILIGSPFLLMSLILYLIILFKKRKRKRSE